MNLESGVRYVLINDAGVLALVGTRVYSGILPQDPTYPAVTIQPITENDNNALASLPALRWARLQIDSWAETYAEAKDLHDKICVALNGQTYNPSGVRIGSIVAQTGGQYSYEPSVGVHRRTRDYGFWYDES
jgi:hypothetical protein